MKKWILSLSIAAGVMSLAACNNANDSETIVESKAGNITKDELYEAMKSKYGKQELQELVYSVVLADKYKVEDKEVNEKLDELKKQYGENFEMVLQQNNLTEEDLRENIKLNLLMEKAAIKDIKVTDEELDEYYENYKPEIRARHILVEDEKTAKEVKKKLDAGSKFEDLAKEYSKDPGSAEKGGDLDWFGPGKMVPEFEETAYALDVNEISDPVQTDHGFHIIQTTEKKEKPSFEEMKKQIEHDVKVSKIDGTSMNNALHKELTDAKVKVNDKDLKGILDKPEEPEGTEVQQ